MKTMLIYAAGWFGLTLMAIINGAVREKIYGRRMRELSAHQVSTVAALVLFSLCLWAFTTVFPIQSAREAAAIGGMWLVMTVAFEFLFGHFVAKHSWRKLFHDYNLLEGRIWSLMLVWTATAPYLFFRFIQGSP